VILCASALACLASAGRGRAEGSAEAETASLRVRLSHLEARDDAEYATGALQQATRALRVASGPATQPAAASRARDIAKAALVLAGRELAYRESQTELLDAQNRLEATRERADAQRRVLEALLKERASLARSGERP